MKRKKIIRTTVLALALLLLGAAGFVYYLFHIPHRDVGGAQADFELSASSLVTEYLATHQKANDKYLDEEGESKILAVIGRVHSITEDMNKQKVVLLKNPGDKAGVSCTFSLANNKTVEKLQTGQTVTIKGVIRSGAGYDDDLGMYEDVILEKSTIISIND